MGEILWEDSIQRDLVDRCEYTGVTAEPDPPPRQTLVTTMEEGRTRMRRATRRGIYFAHTRTGKKYAQQMEKQSHA